MRAKTSWTLYSDVLTITLIPDDKTEAFKLGLDFVTARRAGFHVRMDAHGAIAFCLIKDKDDGALPKGIPAAPLIPTGKLPDGITFGTNWVDDEERHWTWTRAGWERRADVQP